MIANVSFKVNTLFDLSKLKIHEESGAMEKPNMTKTAIKLGVSRETARKYYNGFEKSNTRIKGSKVDKHKDEIRDILTHEYKECAYISHLYRYLGSKYELDYSESTLRYYVKKHFSKEFNNSEKTRSVRFETDPGFQAQSDFKENQTFVNSVGNKIKCDIAVLTFSNSRMTYRK